MKAIILAAGVSRRLYPYTYDMPKCLLDVGGKAIVDHQLNAIKSANIQDVVVVVGYYREKIIEHMVQTYPDLNFHFIVNHHYFETNTAYSLELCRDIVEGTSIVLMNGDVLYPHEVLKRVISSDYDSVLAVDVKPCGREEVKIIEGDHNRVVAIGKELIEENCLGEFIGVAKFSKGFSERFFDSLRKLIKAGGRADYFEAAIHPLLNKNHLHYVDVSDLPCIEIDFIEDLGQARELVKNSLFKLK